MGPEFISLAFKFAHEADPNAVLFYNDYNIERGDKHSSSMLLLKRLIDDGAPIHGVGIQGHWNTDNVPFEEIDKAISNYAGLGLKVSITELDVTIRGIRGPTRTPVWPEAGGHATVGGRSRKTSRSVSQALRDLQ
ncbi:MAG: endo-1,4-beta-xylanase [Pirellulaceae bacterium]